MLKRKLKKKPSEIPLKDFDALVRCIFIFIFLNLSK